MMAFCSFNLIILAAGFFLSAGHELARAIDDDYSNDTVLTVPIVRHSHASLSRELALNKSGRHPAHLHHGRALNIYGPETQIFNSAFLPAVGDNSFFARFQVGSRAVTAHLMIDINAEWTWMQCQPCHTCYDQLDPIFNPGDSDTLDPVTIWSRKCNQVPGRVDPPDGSTSCTYYVAFDDEAFTFGTVMTDNFFFGGRPGSNLRLPITVQGVVFGCSTASRVRFKGAAGILSLGRGYFSLPRQLRRSRVIFSYCLPFSLAHQTATLSIGGRVPLSSPFTPIVDNPNPAFRHLYFVSLVTISFGGIPLPLPPFTFDMDPETGNGGVIFSTIEPITSLPPLAYTMFRDAIYLAITHRSAHLTPAPPFNMRLDSCYVPVSSEIPTSALFDGLPPISFQFAEPDGADLKIPYRNLLVPVVRDPFSLQPSESDRRLCLLVRPSVVPLTILGNHLQMGTRFYFDLKDNRVFIGPETCDEDA
ncbi:hypothetical protein L7F22_030740 [Adiantum nelumboides]|nr:hypothetical protein [Adiantum nelumboides]